MTRDGGTAGGPQAPPISARNARGVLLGLVIHHAAAVVFAWVLLPQVARQAAGADRVPGVFTVCRGLLMVGFAVMLVCGGRQMFRGGYALAVLAPAVRCPPRFLPRVHRGVLVVSGLVRVVLPDVLG